MGSDEQGRAKEEEVMSRQRKAEEEIERDPVLASGLVSTLVLLSV